MKVTVCKDNAVNVAVNTDNTAVISMDNTVNVAVNTDNTAVISMDNKCSSEYG